MSDMASPLSTYEQHRCENAINVAMIRFYALKTDSDNKQSSYIHMYNQGLIPRRSQFSQFLATGSMYASMWLRAMTNKWLLRGYSAAALIHYIDKPQQAVSQLWSVSKFYVNCYKQAFTFLRSVSSVIIQAPKAIVTVNNLVLYLPLILYGIAHYR